LVLHDSAYNDHSNKCGSNKERGLITTSIITITITTTITITITTTITITITITITTTITITITHTSVYVVASYLTLRPLIILMNPSN
jgi:sporulation-control protein spo0M